MHQEKSAQVILVDRNNERMALGDLAVFGSEGLYPGPSGREFCAERHFRIERRDGNYVLRDLRSPQGTEVNGQKVDEAELKDGDLIVFGIYQAIFSVESGPRTSADPLLHSKNSRWAEQLTRIPSIAKSPYPVLLLGPSGTGKEVLAQKLHEQSNRSYGPLVSVNCSALTETLVESELFGHVKGSFTGAIQDRKGAFQAARGGTLFLDEIGDLTYSLQAKILRALENNEIRPVGSDRSIQTDVRIIAATHQNLPSLIESGRFRKDLFYRLNVITLRPPELSDRMEDFDTLLYGFAREMRVRFSFLAIERLKAHPWPGNIRELRNLVARASALFPKTLIEEKQVEELLAYDLAPETEVRGSSEGIPSFGKELPFLKEIERQMIIKRLGANRGNQRQTARDLGLPKSTLHDRLKTYQIDPKQWDASAPS